MAIQNMRDLFALVGNNARVSPIDKKLLYAYIRDVINMRYYIDRNAPSTVEFYNAHIADFNELMTCKWNLADLAKCRGLLVDMFNTVDREIVMYEPPSTPREQTIHNHPTTPNAPKKSAHPPSTPRNQQIPTPTTPSAPKKAKRARVQQDNDNTLLKERIMQAIEKNLNRVATDLGYLSRYSCAFEVDGKFVSIKIADFKH